MAKLIGKPLTDAQKTVITNLFFRRVDNAKRRTKTVKLATFLSDGGADQEAFYSALYRYSLEENWPEADNDYESFNLDGYAPEFNDYREALGLEELKEPKPKKKK